MRTAEMLALEEQPDFLMGGQLRDYQLRGLNFLINRCGQGPACEGASGRCCVRNLACMRIPHRSWAYAGGASL